jgi:hypothetical protein
MFKPKPNALRVVEATLGKIKKVKKPVSKFIIHIVDNARSLLPGISTTQ